jgi:hypothetical protein
MITLSSPVTQHTWNLWCFESEMKHISPAKWYLYLDNVITNSKWPPICVCVFACCHSCVHIYACVCLSVYVCLNPYLLQVYYLHIYYKYNVVMNTVLGVSFLTRSRCLSLHNANVHVGVCVYHIIRTATTSTAKMISLHVLVIQLDSKRPITLVWFIKVHT